MTQILLYRCEYGITLATDSRAVVFDELENTPQHLVVQKLFALSPEVVVVTGGAGFGVLLCRKFQRYITQAGLQDFDDIAETALGFLRSEAESYRRKKPFTMIRPDLDRVYFIIAGHGSSRGRDPFPVIFIASENRDDPMHPVEIPNILSIPRQLSMEYRLTQLSPSEDTLEEVESLFQNFLFKLAAADEDVGPPLHFVRITSHGLAIRSE